MKERAVHAGKWPIVEVSKGLRGVEELVYLLYDVDCFSARPPVWSVELMINLNGGVQDDAVEVGEDQ